MVQTKADRERQKLITDKCQALIEVLLKDEDNKYCVDCDAKGPRWASWNLGIFLCIRCAGIHRNLGVHISRVKSVNLDAWTPEHVAYVQRMGNSRARAIYEANLPDDFRRPQTDTALESFIRAKYEHKRYIDQDYVDPGPPEPAFNADDELKRLKEQKRSKFINSGNSVITISDSFTPAAAAPQQTSLASTICNPSKSRSSSQQQPSLLLGSDSLTSPGSISINTSASSTNRNSKPKSNLADLMDLDLGMGSANLIAGNTSSTTTTNQMTNFSTLLAATNATTTTTNTTSNSTNNSINANKCFTMDAAPTANNNQSITGNTGKNVFDLLDI